MLIRFSFKNFKSIGEESVVLEMVSSSKIRALPNHICASSIDAKILRNAVIYGGNAAGKSSIIIALSFLRTCVVNGFLPQGCINDFCRCESGFKDSESSFDIQFEVNGTVFDYGFDCVLSKLQITSEWLYKLGVTPQLIFFRNAEGITIGDEYLDLREDNDKMRLQVYREDFLQAQKTSLGSHLFLHAMVNGKSYEASSPLAVFPLAWSWFVDNIEIIGAGLPTNSTEFYADDKNLEAVAQVLASFDTGIANLEKKAVSIDELDKYVPIEVLAMIKDALRANMPQSETGKLLLTVRNDKVFLGIEREGTNEPQATILTVKHNGSIYDFGFEDESDGTRRLFDFMDLLFTKHTDKVFIVDELDRSFHPMLTQQLIELFNRIHAHDDCQLIFTTHENDIMSYEYFRRDEIWFVDRDESGYSKLFPLDDFASDGARSDARLGKKYMEGRYGGIPVLSFESALHVFGLEEE